MYVVATGLVCPVGLTADAAAAAMRAGVAAFAELPYFDNQEEPVLGAFVPGIDLDRRRRQRASQMLAAALKDLLNKRPEVDAGRIPLIVGLAEPGRRGGEPLNEGAVREACAAIKISFHPTMSTVLPRGHVAAFAGLHVARRLLEDPDVPACIVAAVDSSINASHLLWLDQHDRLKTSANSNGVIPGEAAGAVLVQRTPPSSGPAIHIVGLGFAIENAHVMSEEPLLGLGLAQATRQALDDAKIDMNQIDFRLSDVTGESYGFKEQSLMLARVLRNGPSALPLWHCADAVGDAGAAAGIVMLVSAFAAFAKGYAPGERAMGFTSSPFGERAVAVLHQHAEIHSRGAAFP